MGKLHCYVDLCYIRTEWWIFVLYLPLWSICSDILFSEKNEVFVSSLSCKNSLHFIFINVFCQINILSVFSQRLHKFPVNFLKNVFWWAEVRFNFINFFPLWLFFSCVLCNKSLFISRSQRYLRMSFPKTVVVLALIFRLVIHFRLIQVWYEIRIEVNFFPRAYPHGTWQLFQHHLLKRLFLLYWITSVPLSKMSVDHTNVDLIFLFLFYFINIFFYPYVSTTQSWFVGLYCRVECLF